MTLIYVNMVDYSIIFYTLYVIYFKTGNILLKYTYQVNKLNKNIFSYNIFLKYLKTYYFLYNKQPFSLTSKKNSKCAPRPVVENC